MKIAIPFQDGFVNEHFGHSENFAVFTINPENQIVDRTIIKADEGCGCKSGIGAVLASEGVTLMLAGNIGGGAIHHLSTEGIGVIRGCSGTAEEVVISYLNGTVADGGQTCEQHAGCDSHPH
ncbi:MAG: NifB/NifX family molybdenum-iron cluster-binding protein [Bacteroidetes bacterium]|nr:NifB/NifX family molybdenum-iron cluster-binding protein [Bacteroidota bacterium]